MDEKDRSLDEIFGNYLGGGRGESERRIPFKFLDPYEAEDREIFFGREEEVKELYKKCFSSNLLLLYGESGTGKTSLLRCGLLGRIPSSDVFLIHIRNSGGGLEALEQEIKGPAGPAESGSKRGWLTSFWPGFGRSGAMWSFRICKW